MKEERNSRIAKTTKKKRKEETCIPLEKPVVQLTDAIVTILFHKLVMGACIDETNEHRETLNVKKLLILNKIRFELYNSNAIYLNDISLFLTFKDFNVSLINMANYSMSK